MHDSHRPGKTRLHNQEKQRRPELTALYHLSEKLGESNRLDEVLKIVVENPVKLLHVTFARTLQIAEQVSSALQRPQRGI